MVCAVEESNECPSYDRKHRDELAIFPCSCLSSSDQQCCWDISIHRCGDVVLAHLPGMSSNPDRALVASTDT